ncbi:hemolysin III family protein [Erysipelothrix sp. HDW6C]|uniref:PAQR family membrane homeostasis protein TrhA n=1 Tax=Erysipelothrix sp. HDW6C TaxID=2714930 RepID=UPI00140B69B4|nr:hemolysin III family protein [Erysipelothrix sp. HDW6C]QIK69979.1 hemolysin III family protein [Erysipelothrix sp. HDW6C]
MTKKDVSMKDYKRLSFGEEVANSVSHGIMVVFLLVMYPYVSVRAYAQGGWLLVFGDAVFIISLFLMFMGSTLYHAMENDSKAKYIFRILDHSFIFVAIAGTYTPIALTVLDGWIGYAVVFIQWFMVIVGILQKTVAKRSMPKLSVAIYLVMGWAAVMLMPQLIKNTSAIFIGLIILGGVFYSIGTYFYLQKDKKYYHFIWHLFINAASLSHFIAIVYFMV